LAHTYWSIDVTKDPKQHPARMMGNAFFILVAKYRNMQKNIQVMNPDTIEPPIVNISPAACRLVIRSVE